MNQARLWLIIGIAVSALVGATVYSRLGLVAAFLAAGILLIVVAGLIHYIFRFYLPNRKFKEFLQGNLLFECKRNGRCCYLWVELDKNDYDRIITHARKLNMNKEVIFKRGDKHWLAHRKGSACIFLEKAREENTCAIYDIRPTACRLYPIVPEGEILRLDIGCSSCLNREKGMNLTEYLQSQGVMGYVRKHWADGEKYLPKQR